MTLWFRTLSFQLNLFKEVTLLRLSLTTSIGAILLFATSFLAGCASFNVTPTTNTIDEMNNVEFENTAQYSSGESCSQRILMFGPFGKASFTQAAKQGNIDNIKYTDFHYSNFLGLVSYQCINVYGE